jgi:hypothetical protein
VTQHKQKKTHLLFAFPLVGDMEIKALVVIDQDNSGVYRDTEGNLKGVVWETWLEVVSELEWKPTYSYYEGSPQDKVIIDKMNTGEYDVLVGRMVVSKANDAQLQFTTPLMISKPVILYFPERGNNHVSLGVRLRGLGIGLYNIVLKWLIPIVLFTLATIKGSWLLFKTGRDRRKAIWSSMTVLVLQSFTRAKQLARRGASVKKTDAVSLKQMLEVYVDDPQLDCIMVEYSDIDAAREKLPGLVVSQNDMGINYIGLAVPPSRQELLTSLDVIIRKLHSTNFISHLCELHLPEGRAHYCHI